MPHIISVVYPAGAKFDMDYYLATHMPLVQKLWSPHGLRSWKVVQYNGADSPYIVQAWLEWESSEHADKGTASPEAAPIFADIANFCDKQPVLMAGPQTGSASW